MAVDYQEKDWGEHQLISSYDLNRIEKGVADAVTQVNKNTETVQANKEAIAALENRVISAEGAQETAAQAQQKVAEISAQIAGYDAQARQLLEEAQKAAAASEKAQEAGEAAKEAADSLKSTCEQASSDAASAKQAAEEVRNLADQTKEAAEKTASDAAAVLEESKALQNTAEESAQKAAVSETNAAKSASDAQEAINTVSAIKLEVTTDASRAVDAASDAIKISEQVSAQAEEINSIKNVVNEKADQVSLDVATAEEIKSDMAAKVLEISSMVSEAKTTEASIEEKSVEFDATHDAAVEELDRKSSELKTAYENATNLINNSADTAKESIASSGQIQLTAISNALNNFDNTVEQANSTISSKVNEAMNHSTDASRSAENSSASASEAADSASQASQSADEAGKSATAADTSAKEAAASVESAADNVAKLEQLLASIEEDKKAIEEYQKAIDEQFEALKADFNKIDPCSCDNSRDPMIQILSDRLTAMENKHIADKIEASQMIDITETATTTLNSADVVVAAGTTLDDVTRTVSAKNIIIPGANLTNSKLTLKAQEDVVVSGLATSGEFPKKSGNTPLTINANGAVSLKNCSLNQLCYNGIEVGLGTGMTPSEVVIEGVHGDTVTNNFISVFDLEAGSTLIIRNCSVQKCSNFIRLSSKNDHVYNVILDSCEMGECDEGVWHGWVCLEDYTSAKAGKDPLEVKQFANMNITMINCTMKGQKITKTDPAEICGTQNEDQVFCLCNDPSADILPYDSGLYPSIKIMYR